MQAYGSNSGVSPEVPQDAPLVPPSSTARGLAIPPPKWSVTAGHLKCPLPSTVSLTLNFTVDSGAADVSVPADVFMTLVRTGTITDADYLDKQTYRLADGSTLPSQRFVIRSLRVGDKTVGNVVGSIAPVEGACSWDRVSLAVSTSWSIDNHLQALVLRSSSSTANATASPAQSRAGCAVIYRRFPEPVPLRADQEIAAPILPHGRMSWISIENRESLGQRRRWRIVQGDHAPLGG